MATYQTLLDSEEEAIQDDESEEIVTRELIDIPLRSGNFIAIHAEVPGVEDVSIIAKTKKAIPFDDNGIAVLRITNKNSQIIVVASKAGYPSVTRRFNLTNLICEAEG